MKTYSIMVLLILAISSVEAFEYQEQTLQPLTHSDTGPSVTHSQRLFAPKKKTYPFLDQLESLLYPSKNFKSEHPGQRLERLELAVFGDKQSGGISSRLNKLQTELENWQIGNMKAIKNYEVNGSHTYDSRSQIPFTAHPSALTSQPYHKPQAMPKDYDHMNSRLVTPLVQNISRRAIDAIFK